MTQPSSQIRRLLRQQRGTAVKQALTSLPEPGSSQPCSHPDCRRLCVWDKRGRPRRFCSDKCRGTFAKERARVLDELAAYQELATLGSPTWEEENALKRRMQALQMRMDRLRPFADDRRV